MCYKTITFIAYSIKRYDITSYFLDIEWHNEQGKVFLIFSAFPLHDYINFLATIHHHAKRQIVGLEIC